MALDPKAIRALAHPLRLDLLDVLTAIGPATAAQCGRVLDVPQANCSFHLRQLAKYGFVADAGPGADRRERRWRVTDPRPVLRIGPGADETVRNQLERVVVEREAQAILDYTERRAEENPDWRDRAGVTAALVTMSPDDAEQLKQEWRALVERYAAKTGPGAALAPGQRRVRIFMAATPMPATAPAGEAPPGPTDETTSGENRDDIH